MPQMPWPAERTSGQWWTSQTPHKQFCLRSPAWQTGLKKAEREGLTGLPFHFQMRNLAKTSGRHVVGQRAGDAVEEVPQAVTESGGSKDDTHRDKCGDQAVLDCSRARLVLRETCENVHSQA